MQYFIYIHRKRYQLFVAPRPLPFQLSQLLKQMMPVVIPITGPVATIIPMRRQMTLLVLININLHPAAVLGSANRRH
jgi:hypothetical protein